MTRRDLGAVRAAFGAERKRMDDTLARATPPDRCGDAIPVAPARGAQEVFRPERAEIGAGGGIVFRHDGWMGRDAVRAASPLRVIEARSRRRGGDSVVFTNAQHVAAETYAALVQGAAAEGLRGTNLLGNGGGSGDDGGWMDRHIGVTQRLARMRNQIGLVAALVPEGRMAQPGRLTIRRIEVLDWVVVVDAPLDRLLQRRGWAPQTRYRRALLDGLIAALDAIYGV